MMIKKIVIMVIGTFVLLPIIIAIIALIASRLVLFVIGLPAIVISVMIDTLGSMNHENNYQERLVTKLVKAIMLDKPDEIRSSVKKMKEFSNDT